MGMGTRGRFFCINFNEGKTENNLQFLLEK